MLFGPEESPASIFLNSELVSTKAELTRVAAELVAEKEKHRVSELAFRDQIAASERCLEETQAESSALKKDKAGEYSLFFLILLVPCSFLSLLLLMVFFSDCSIGEEEG